MRVVLSAALFLALLVACGDPRFDADRSATGGMSVRQLQGPPELRVSTPEDRVVAARGAYCWTTDLLDMPGHAVSECASSAGYRSNAVALRAAPEDELVLGYAAGNPAAKGTIGDVTRSYPTEGVSGESVGWNSLGANQMRFFPQSRREPHGARRARRIPNLPRYELGPRRRFVWHLPARGVAARAKLNLC
jgi:hypothetical protein